MRAQKLDKQFNVYNGPVHRRYTELFSINAPSFFIKTLIYLDLQLFPCQRHDLTLSLKISKVVSQPWLTAMPVLPCMGVVEIVLPVADVVYDGFVPEK